MADVIIRYGYYNADTTTGKPTYTADDFNSCTAAFFTNGIIHAESGDAVSNSDLYITVSSCLLSNESLLVKGTLYKGCALVNKHWVVVDEAGDFSVTFEGTGDPATGTTYTGYFALTESDTTIGLTLTHNLPATESVILGKLTLKTSATMGVDTATIDYTTRTIATSRVTSQSTVSIADKAIADENGNNIKDTYVTKDEIACNLLDLRSFTKATQNGITVINNGGVISISGTNINAQTEFILRGAWGSSIPIANISNGDTVTYTLGIAETTEQSGWSLIYADASSNMTILSPNDVEITKSGFTPTCMTLVIKANETVNTTIFPKIELGSVSHSFVPFTGSTGQINTDLAELVNDYADKASLSEVNNKIACNLLDISGLSSVTAKGLTITPQSDGTIIINGTHDGVSGELAYILVSDFPYIQDADYTICANDIIGSGLFLDIFTASYSDWRSVSGMNSITIKSISIIRLVIPADSSVTYTDYVIKPMVELGTTAHRFVQYTGTTGQINSDLANITKSYANKDMINDINNKITCNLLDIKDFTSMTLNGITVKNINGTLKVSGTNGSSQTTFPIRGSWGGTDPIVSLSSTDTATYSAGVEESTTYGGWSLVFADSVPTVVSLSTTDAQVTQTNFIPTYMYLVIQAGETLDLTLYPKIELGTEIHAFVPYTGSTGKINTDLAELNNKVNDISKPLYNESVTATNTDDSMTISLNISTPELWQNAFVDMKLNPASGGSAGVQMFIPMQYIYNAEDKTYTSPQMTLIGTDGTRMICMFEVKLNENTLTITEVDNVSGKPSGDPYYVGCYIKSATIYRA